MSKAEPGKKEKMIVAEVYFNDETHTWEICECLNLQGDYSGTNCEGFSHGPVKESDLD